MSTDFDAIVVGSGISGGWAAKELTENGFKTLVLERGREIKHVRDYQGEHKPPWHYPFRHYGDRKLYERDYFIQSGFGWFNEHNRQFWNNDRLNPYVVDEEKPFHWVRGDILGGRSVLWGRQCYRWSDLDFEANRKDGHGIDWPIRYKDIAPWYSYVEKFAGVSGQAEGLPHLPDGEFLKPMVMNSVERHVKAAIETNFPGRTMTIGRVAVLTEPHNGRGACHYCGPCDRGCSVAAYFCSLTSTLPAAKATGLLTIRTDSVVERLDTDPRTGRIASVSVVDARTRERLRFSARVVFLCASTVGSTQILLNSRDERHPNGLANGSGVLGRYLMDHTFGTGVSGVIPGFLDRDTIGARPNGIYIPRFRNLDGQDPDAPFLRGYGFQGGASRQNWSREVPGFGKALKEELARPGPWVMHLGGFGEILPYAGNRMLLDERKVDRFGIPQVRFEVEYKDNEKKMIDDIMERGKEMLKAAGATDIRAHPGPMIMGRGVHEMGTARMGDDPRESVLNRWNQAHEVPNLFVTDGSCMTSGSCVNPSITYMAITARAANHAAELLRAGTL
ncbi:MAG TPA: GMC family oxidoreductase [Woeseiaceae bacterium]|nr:GMC family oxidoreductase [Woeseiaceae bacterium]